ncbi:MAG: hypothetical protein ACE5SV_08890, partial [Candidatus Nitrosomaritimum aestuariumsis]
APIQTPQEAKKEIKNVIKQARENGYDVKVIDTPSGKQYSVVGSDTAIGVPTAGSNLQLKLQGLQEYVYKLNPSEKDVTITKLRADKAKADVEQNETYTKIIDEAIKGLRNDSDQATKEVVTGKPPFTYIQNKLKVLENIKFSLKKLGVTDQEITLYKLKGFNREVDPKKKSEITELLEKYKKTEESPVQEMSFQSWGTLKTALKNGYVSVEQLRYKPIGKVQGAEASTAQVLDDVGKLLPKDMSGELNKTIRKLREEGVPDSQIWEEVEQLEGKLGVTGRLGTIDPDAIADPIVGFGPKGTSAQVIGGASKDVKTKSGELIKSVGSIDNEKELAYAYARLLDEQQSLNKSSDILKGRSIELTSQLKEVEKIASQGNDMALNYQKAFMESGENPASGKPFLYTEQEATIEQLKIRSNALSDQTVEIDNLINARKQTLGIDKFEQDLTNATEELNGLKIRKTMGEDVDDAIQIAQKNVEERKEDVQFAMTNADWNVDIIADDGRRITKNLITEKEALDRETKILNQQLESTGKFGPTEAELDILRSYEKSFAGDSQEVKDAVTARNQIANSSVKVRESQKELLGAWQESERAYGSVQRGARSLAWTYLDAYEKIPYLRSQAPDVLRGLIKTDSQFSSIDLDDYYQFLETGKAPPKITWEWKEFVSTVNDKWSKTIKDPKTGKEIPVGKIVERSSELLSEYDPNKVGMRG